MSPGCQESNAKLLEYKRTIQWYEQHWPRWLREEPPLEFPLEQPRQLLFHPLPGTRSAMQGLLSELELTTPKPELHSVSCGEGFASV